MNIAMEQTEEYVNGQLKAKYGDCFIRGNNGGARLLFACACSFSGSASHRVLPVLVFGSLVHFCVKEEGLGGNSVITALAAASEPSAVLGKRAARVPGLSLALGPDGSGSAVRTRARSSGKCHREAGKCGARCDLFAVISRSDLVLLLNHSYQYAIRSRVYS
jgi:hypothetical protein